MSPLGSFLNVGSGVVQVVDTASCEATVSQLREDAGVDPFDKFRASNFAGLLIDFDHFSLDLGAKSMAAVAQLTIKMEDSEQVLVKLASIENRLLHNNWRISIQTRLVLAK